jgi:MFS family permease
LRLPLNYWQMKKRLNSVGVVRSGWSGRAPLGSSFWALWRSSALSGLGDGIILAALPLLAARITGSAFLVSLVVVVQRLPWVVVAIPAGAFVDRQDPARAMVAADIVRGGLLAMVSLLLALGDLSIVTLCCAALALGTFDTVFAAGAQAMIPRVVAGESLDLANGRLSVAQTTTGHFLGPALGGALFALNQVIPFAVDSASFFGSAGMLRGLRGRFRPHRPARSAGGPPAGRPSLRADMAEGLAFFRHSPVLPLLAVLTGGLALFQASVLSPFVLFALRDLHLSRAGYGIFLAVAALGNVAGALLAPRLRQRFSAAALFTGAGVVAGAAYLAVAFTSSVLVAQGAFIVEAAAVAGGSVVSISLRQRHIPQPLMGRVSNVFRAIIWGAIPVGGLLGGVLADLRGLRSPFVVAGLAQIALVAGLALPLRRRVRAAGTGGAGPASPAGA